MSGQGARSGECQGPAGLLRRIALFNSQLKLRFPAQARLRQTSSWSAESSVGLVHGAGSQALVQSQLWCLLSEPVVELL